MKKQIHFYLFILFFLLSCGSQEINQKRNKERHGKWVEKYQNNNIQYTSIGKYKNGDPIGKWKYFANDSLIKVEIHRKLKTKIRFYHKNGQLESRGISILDTTPKKLHWFYHGKWKYYLADGQLAITRNYNKGELLNEIQHPTKP